MEKHNVLLAFPLSAPFLDVKLSISFGLAASE